MNITKEKKNIVADPTFNAVIGRRVKLSTMKADYDDALIIQFDQYTMIIEVEGVHYLLSKSAIIDLVIPSDLVGSVIGNIDSAFKQIDFHKQRKANKPKPRTNTPHIQVKKSRTYTQPY